ncbi:MAG: ribonuclease H-like domain-containing protein [Eubacteriales bacterium]|nr:ribonuclease H-like domain-containing protein [Eubacteriales bacterium]
MQKKDYIFPAAYHQQQGEAPILFLDIETTGFQRNTTILYLIGCGFYENGLFHVIQWFNDDAVSETEMLLSLQSFLEAKSPIIFSYNGDSFDLPYLNYHYSLHDIPFDITKYNSFDFYKALQPFQSLLGLPQGRQKDWEGFLGLEREDIYEGGELIAVYKQYLKNKDDSLEHCLLLHNLEDLRGMETLLPLCSYHQLLQADFSFGEMGYNSCESFPMSDSVTFFCTLNKKIPKKLTLDPFLFEENSMAGAVYAHDYQLSLTMPIYDTTFKYFYSDYKNYYYLPEEDMAVHKSIGCYVDASHRKKASPSNCYQKKEGLYLPLLPDKSYRNIHTETKKYCSFLTLYKQNYKDKISYINLEQLYKENQTILPLYLSDWMKQTFMAYIRTHAS